ncbi:MAG: hypothetical protein JSV07_02040 [Acidimicrobiia bacterium]|nr:MAG: hypothetical protein JSV07_02040 [Acidimicrobiia bacterium]
MRASWKVARPEASIWPAPVKETSSSVTSRPRSSMLPAPEKSTSSSLPENPSTTTRPAPITSSSRRSRTVTMYSKPSEGNGMIPSSISITRRSPSVYVWMRSRRLSSPRTVSPSRFPSSMIIVPKDATGVEIEKEIEVFGYHDRSGHPQVAFHDVRVPAGNLLGDEGSGFAIAQARLGPGRIHHCMRAIGMAERAFDMMCSRALARETFGKTVADHDTVREVIAEARMKIEQARLLTLKTAWLIDTQGVKGARIEISAIKVAVPRMAQWVIDQAIQLFGGAGFTQDFPLAAMYAQARTLRMADGPDAVHLRTLARREIRRYEAGFIPEPWPHEGT